MGFNFRTLLETAIEEGKTSEDTMWKSVDTISELMERIKDDHAPLYWSFMRGQYGLMYGNHYGKMFAEYDVNSLVYSDKDGKREQGGHWTSDEIEFATANFVFPEGTTKWDKFVAFNAIYADLCKVLSEDAILKAGHSFFFADEDWKSRTKVWDYFSCKSN